MSVSRKRALSLDTDPPDGKKGERGSGRQLKPVKRRQTEEPSFEPKKIESKVNTKVKRQVWTSTAVDAFFEGLYQHGKDFHQILKYMQSKYRKKNDPTIPNLTKNQVRFYYYRTWHKVSALLGEPSHQPTDSKKASKGAGPSSTPKFAPTDASPLPPTIPLPPPAPPATTGGEATTTAGNEAAGTTTACAEAETTQPTGGETATATASVGAEGRGSLLEEEGENPLDSSLEEVELGEAAAFQDGEPGEDLGSPAPLMEVEVGGKGKEEVESSPGGIAVTTMDKCEGKRDACKDTVVVNGVRHSLDLVALICYCKLKKKCPALGEHNLAKKLQELLHQGTTTIPSRVKGKRKLTIKIPSCRALQQPGTKRVTGEEQVPDPVVEVIVEQGGDSVLSEPEPCTPGGEGPQMITVELRPLSSASWFHVQGLAQNPRLRLRVSASRTVTQLLQFLALKWQLKSPDSSSQPPVSLYHMYACCRWRSRGSTPSASPNTNLLSHEQDRNIVEQSAEVVNSDSHHSPASKLDMHVYSFPTPKTERQDEAETTTPNSVVSSVEKVVEQESKAQLKLSDIVHSEVIDCDVRQESHGNTSSPSPQVGDTAPSTEGTNPPCPSFNPTDHHLNSHSNDIRHHPISSGPFEFSRTSNESQSLTKDATHHEKPEAFRTIHSEVIYSEESSSGSDTLGGVRTKRLCVSPQCSLNELHYRFYRPERLQFLYELQQGKEPPEGKLRTALKLVEFLTNREKMRQQPPTGSTVHPSPTVAEYIRSLPKKSPRKSPLAKYWRLKNRSPMKSALVRQPAKRVRLNFDAETPQQAETEPTLDDNTPEITVESNEDSPLQSKENTAFPESSMSATTHPPIIVQATLVPSLTVTPSISATDREEEKSVTSPHTVSVKGTQNPTTALLTPPLASGSPTIMNVLQMHQNSPEIIQLTKAGESSRDPKMCVLSVSKKSLKDVGSFSSLELQNLFSAASESLQKTGLQRTYLGGLLSRRVAHPAKSASASPKTPKRAAGETGGEMSLRETPPQHSTHSTPPSHLQISSVRTRLLQARNEGASSNPSLDAAKQSTVIRPHVVPSAVCSKVTIATSGDHTASEQSASRQVLVQNVGQDFQGQTAATRVQMDSSLRSTSLAQLSSSTLQVQPPSTSSSVHLSLSQLSSGRQSSRAVTQLSTAIPGPLPVVSALKPYSKPPRRPKKAVTRTGTTRQLVPRPLPFLPNLPHSTTLSQPSLVPIPSPQGTPPPPTTTSHPPSTASNTESIPVQHAISGGEETTHSNASTTTSLLQNNLVLAIMQALLLQQQQQQQRLQAVQTAKPAPSGVTSAAQTKEFVSSATAKGNASDQSLIGASILENVPEVQQDFQVSETEVQGAILENLLAERLAGESSNTSRVFCTSSDTVNELLRGLSSKRDEGIQRLSEETADVLPTFAKALGASIGTTEGVSPTPVSSTAVESTDGAVIAVDTVDVERIEEENVEGVTASDSANADQGENSHLSFSMNENSLSEVLGAFSDSTFRGLEQLDFSDAFSQLRDVLRTPEKGRHLEGDLLPLGEGVGPSHLPHTDSEVSLGGLLDFLASPEKDQLKPPSESDHLALNQVDPAYRSILGEDVSVDYIQKFKELASKMNSQT